MTNKHFPSRRRSRSQGNWYLSVLSGLALLPLLLLTCGSESAKERWSRNSFDPRTGIPILFYWEENPFPPHWRQDPINGQIFQLNNLEDALRSSRAVRKAMDAYPRTLLRKTVTRIYCPQSLVFFGLSYGATNSRRNLYLSNPGTEYGYSERHLERVFHHELSSMLLRNHENSFDTITWKQFLPEGFRYGSGGKDAIHNGKSCQFLDNTLNEKGFINEYSMSSRENDINEIVEHLFVPDPRFWTIVDAVPQLRGKVELIIDFYAGIHPGFSEEYFRGLGE